VGELLWAPLQLFGLLFICSWLLRLVVRAALWVEVPVLDAWKAVALVLGAGYAIERGFFYAGLQPVWLGVVFFVAWLLMSATVFGRIIGSSDACPIGFKKGMAVAVVFALACGLLSYGPYGILYGMRALLASQEGPTTYWGVLGAWGAIVLPLAAVALSVDLLLRRWRRKSRSVAPNRL
jgi:hypothetical protein